MVHAKHMALIQTKSALLRLLLACVLLAGWIGTARAVSLLQVRSTAMDDGELLTLTFDQDLSLRITTASGQTIQLQGTSPFFNDAVVPSSQLLTAIDVDNSTLSLTCKKPAKASLRRAGAGMWLLMLRPTGEPPQPVQAERHTATQPQTRTQTPQPVEEAEPEPEPEPAQIEDQLSDADLLMLAQLHKLQGRNEQAKETIEQIPENTDSYPWGRLLMGNLKEAEGDESGAKQEYEKALEYRQTMSAAATSIALWHQRRGEQDKAEDMWEMVLRSDDASVPPLAQGQGDGTGSGDQAFVRNASNVQQRGESSGITFDGNGTPMQFFDTRVLIIIVIALIVTGAIAGGLLFHRTRKKEKGEQPADAREDAVFWGDENDEDEDATGSLEAELAGEKPNGVKPKGREMDVSAETRKMVVDMHNSGNSVREIAEVTGKSQDEIRMALQMEGVTAEP
ncbi:hypothetical protein KQI52_00410 [bacterium]|nr:hypothetical protein [bacterium]